MEKTQPESACFTGHRPKGLPAGGVETAPEMQKLLLMLYHAVEDAADRGVRTFYAGGAAGFDTHGAEAVLTLKRFRPEIRLVLALPTREPNSAWSERQKRRFQEIMSKADEIHAETEGPATVAALHARNRFMVDHADLVISYLSAQSGGTYATVRYAEKKGVPVQNLLNELVEEFI